jgi:thiol:disulfide interchange protein DsbD
MRRIVVAVLGVTLLLAVPAFAQLLPSSSVVSLTPIHEQESYKPGESARLLFAVSFAEGYHGQAHEPTLDWLIPTTLTVTGPEGIAVGRIAYPAATMVTFGFSDEPLATYEHLVHFGTTIAVAPDLAPGDYTINAALKVQACSDEACLPPSTIRAPVIVNVADREPTRINTPLFDANESLFGGGGGERHGADGGDIARSLADNGLPLTFLLIFVSGLALNLTPCVYPLIPITISYFGGQSEKKQGHLPIHAFLYLMGMAAMYSTMGLFAALTGSLFGALLQSWPVILIIVTTLIGLALAMFGVWEIRMPGRLADFGGKNREGFFGTFMMGLTVGVVAAPCIGPFVLGLLTFVGERQDPVLGFTMFFTLAVGLGAPLVVLALFSGSMRKLPRSGLWMIWVKRLFGVILLGMALYFAAPLLPEGVIDYAAALLLVGGAIHLGLLTKVKAVSAGFRWIKGGTALLLAAAGIFFLLPSVGDDGPGLAWVNGTESTLDEAVATGKPVIVDFTADWCLPCRELEHFTFSDPAVIEAGDRFALVRVDVTTGGESEGEKLKARFGVVGVPTVIFLAPGGAERTELRFVGFVDAETLLEKMAL